MEQNLTHRPAEKSTIETSILGKITIARYRFQLIATQKTALPCYKGSAFHGGFGHALRQIAPTWYQHLFEPEKSAAHFNPDFKPPDKSAWPKPFVLLPPLDEQQGYAPGESFYCEITLFGHAIQHFPVCHAALEYLGSQMGLGRDQGRFKIEHVEEAKTNTSRPPVNPQQITLHFPTRLRLKSNNRLCRNELPFKLFFERLIGRLNTLALFYGEGEIIDHTQRRALLEHAEKITIKKDDLHWQEWDRFSGRQKAWMKFGGLLGEITYEGDLEPFIPYLTLGEWVHIGGKTSFGLGKYEVR
ncbi:MAG TPA: CRISPR system precrRNA processing endoribonuclease RAMP protein Cas6 [Gammaproteobacteria bacterium]|nr:CRISPR system precrRNA processing endoribonuclease RAMP protein Cas6 [Gammaproteobacteria bacterium]